MLASQPQMELNLVAAPLPRKGGSNAKGRNKRRRNGGGPDRTDAAKRRRLMEGVDTGSEFVGFTGGSGGGRGGGRGSKHGKKGGDFAGSYGGSKGGWGGRGGEVDEFGTHVLSYDDLQYGDDIPASLDFESGRRGTKGAKGRGGKGARSRRRAAGGADSGSGADSGGDMAGLLGRKGPGANTTGGGGGGSGIRSSLFSKEERIAVQKSAREVLKSGKSHKKGKRGGAPPAESADRSRSRNGDETGVPGERTALFAGTQFSSLHGLDPKHVANIKAELNISSLTNIQAAAIPALLDGADVLMSAKTGAGKTIAFLVPLVQRLAERTPRIQRSDGSYAVVIAPTRELALQLYTVAKAVMRPFYWLVPGMVTGGEKRKSEKARLRKGLTLLVATPGRLLDHLQTTAAFSTTNLEWLVLDEADRLMDLGFERELTQILALLSSRAAARYQSVLLSATLHANVERLARLSLHNPVRVTEEDGKRRDAEPTTTATTTTTSSSTNTTATAGSKAKSAKDKIARALARAVGGDSGSSSGSGSGGEGGGESGDGSSDDVDLHVRYAGGDSDDDVVPADSVTFTAPAQLIQEYVVVPAKQRLVTLSGFLLERSREAESKVIVFMSSCDSVDYHYVLFASVDVTQVGFGHHVADLSEHHDLSPNALLSGKLAEELKKARAKAERGSGSDSDSESDSDDDEFDSAEYAQGLVGGSSSGGGDGDGVESYDGWSGSGSGSGSAGSDGSGGGKSRGSKKRGGKKGGSGKGGDAATTTTTTTATTASKKGAKGKGGKGGKGDKDDKTGGRRRGRRGPAKWKPSSGADSLPARASSIFGSTSVYRLHGQMAQGQRQATYTAFSESSSGILLCTDVAARGLDLPRVDWIVQYDPPTTAEDYVHRIGRTARIGREGRALLFLLPSEKEYIDLLAERGLTLGEVSQGVTLAGLCTATRRDVERQALSLQSSFEGYVANAPEVLKLAKAGFMAFVRAYGAHGSEEKHIFHIKALHLGHIAKAFALRSAPSALTSKKAAKRNKQDAKKGRAGYTNASKRTGYGAERGGGGGRSRGPGGGGGFGGGSGRKSHFEGALVNPKRADHRPVGPQL